MPSSSQAIFQNAKKRADKLQAKNKPVDFAELLKMERDGGTINVRNYTHWLGVENRCVIPMRRFAETVHSGKVGGGHVPNAWFARQESVPLIFFAGVWVPQ